MPTEEISGLISRLHEVLENTEGTNTELLARVQQLREQAISGDSESMADQLNLLEAEFANEHPVADSILRELIDIFARLGI